MNPANNNINNIAGNSLGPTVYAISSYGKYHFVNPRTMANIIQLKNTSNLNNRALINKINAVLSNTSSNRFEEINSHGYSIWSVKNPFLSGEVLKKMNVKKVNGPAKPASVNYSYNANKVRKNAKKLNNARITQEKKAHRGRMSNPEERSEFYMGRFRLHREGANQMVRENNMSRFVNHRFINKYITNKNYLRNYRRKIYANQYNYMTSTYNHRVTPSLQTKMKKLRDKMKFVHNLSKFTRASKFTLARQSFENLLRTFGKVDYTLNYMLNNSRP